MAQQLLDDLQALETKEVQSPSWMLWWLTIGTAIYLGIWLFPMRWLNYSVKPAYQGMLVIAFFVVLVPFFWAGAKAIQKGWKWGMVYGFIWVYCLVITALSRTFLPLDSVAYYSGEGEITAVALLLLVVEHQRRRSAYPVLWTSIGLLAQAYLLQWFWIESLQYFLWEVLPSTTSTFNLGMLVVPITVAFGISVVRIGRIWMALPKVEAVVWMLLLLGLYVSWVGTGCYWYGDTEALRLLQGVQSAWQPDNFWQERGALLRAIGLALYLLSIAASGTLAMVRSSWASA